MYKSFDGTGEEFIEELLKKGVLSPGISGKLEAESILRALTRESETIAFSMDDIVWGIKACKDNGCDMHTAMPFHMYAMDIFVKRDHRGGILHGNDGFPRLCRLHLLSEDVAKMCEYLKCPTPHSKIAEATFVSRFLTHGNIEKANADARDDITAVHLAEATRIREQ